MYAHAHMHTSNGHAHMHTSNGHANMHTSNGHAHAPLRACVFVFIIIVGGHARLFLHSC